MNEIKVCVLGATGFVGSAITTELDKRNIDWIGVSRSVNKDTRIKTLSLHETEKFTAIINEYPHVINAMGSFKPADFESNTKTVFQTFWDNLQLLNLILIKAKTESLLHISSGGTVYGDYNGRPSLESDWLKPKSWYGKAKVIEESILEKASIQGNFNYICARVANPYGNLKFTHHGFIDVLISTIRNGGKFHTFNNDTYSRDFIHCSDMAYIIIELLKHSLSSEAGNSVFNVASGKSVTLKGIMQYVKSISPTFEGHFDRLPTDYDVITNELDINAIKSIGIKVDDFFDVKQYLAAKINNGKES
ncbi:NAD-dependent epimerase/dehydratase family protein [Shewanella aestuarii]|uniref:dTDP-4-dehydrorhamnose reductase n=1 Tax=Shewanella aestuarii TaxID=1028752 RepID=A0A6G9QMT3_9GAMM|nr:NAD-dependent epimerase/dehydratase family protein [Shewanella aestuarii]QIR15131.1 NAD-dependent epimerase/dehydratase family protein [Shewanella aestuarii]